MRYTEEQKEEIRRTVREAISQRQHVITYALARKCLSLFEEMNIGTDSALAPEQTEWIRIESLSRLRALVGGRFQNLKERWVKAGFPLREHRGDRSGGGVVDYEAWVELSSWIHQQGFEIRLASESDPWLFEIRAIGSDK